MKIITSIKSAFSRLFRGLLCSFAFAPAHGQAKADSTIKHKPATEQEMYFGLRSQALSLTPEQLHIKSLPDTEVYGVIMEWTMDDNLLTVVALKTGCASLYTSSGFGIIGGGDAYETVNQAAKTLVSDANNYLSRTTKNPEITNPEKGYNHYYFLTKQGRYYKSVAISMLNDDTSDFTQLNKKTGYLINIYLEENKKHKKQLSTEK